MYKHNLKTIYYKDVEFDIYYSVFGKYRPATYWEPTEFPEYELEKICTSKDSQDIMDFLDTKVVDDLYEILIDKINEEEN